MNPQTAVTGIPVSVVTPKHSGLSDHHRVLHLLLYLPVYRLTRDKLPLYNNWLWLWNLGSNHTLWLLL